MNKEHKTTEFSLHISRSRMRRYLHDQLNPKEVSEVETHLKHCIHCSEAIVQYITSEEPENYKTYMKALKGKIIESAKPKGPRFSSVQVKTMRAAAAVVILLSFSFFAFENLIDKDFSLVAQPEQDEAAFVRKSVFPEDKQKARQVKEQTLRNEEKPEEADQKEEEPQPEVQVAEAKKKPSATPATQPRPKQEVKKEAKKPTTVTTTPQVAERADEEAEETRIEEKPETVAAVDHTEPAVKTEASTEEQKLEVPTVAPIESVEAGNEASNLPEENTEQVIPSASVGQLRQQ